MRRVFRYWFSKGCVTARIRRAASLVRSRVHRPCIRHCSYRPIFHLEPKRQFQGAPLPGRRYSLARLARPATAPAWTFHNRYIMNLSWIRQWMYILRYRTAGLDSPACLLFDVPLNLQHCTSTSSSSYRLQYVASSASPFDRHRGSFCDLHPSTSDSRREQISWKARESPYQECEPSRTAESHITALSGL